MTKDCGPRINQQWAQLRFSVTGHLLAVPPAKGALRAALKALAAQEWRHPASGAPVRFGVSTIERWYYRALRKRQDPVGVLRRKRRQDSGSQTAMSEELRQALLGQYAARRVLARPLALWPPRSGWRPARCAASRSSMSADCGTSIITTARARY